MSFFYMFFYHNLQVAWESLVDALIHLPIVACETNASKEETIYSLNLTN